MRVNLHQNQQVLQFQHLLVQVQVSQQAHQRLSLQVPLPQHLLVQVSLNQQVQAHLSLLQQVFLLHLLQ